ncbi:MAG TPA: hypothetical protein VHD89_09040 [Rhodanobacteraceae bacterium]|nr:hypothetical protein [Rhodanobacteraceae bacterium]
MTKFLAAVFCIVFSGCVSAACPKLLYWSINHYAENDAADAHYWGKTVGAQGVFVTYYMTYWTTNVGATHNKLWDDAKKFQQTYAKYGVTDNFLKVSIYSKLNWNNPAVVKQYITNFGNLAKMAKYAGFKGIALDLEPYNPAWGGGAGGNAQIVQNAGRSIGQAMHQAYPGMTLIVLPDVVHQYNATKDRDLASGGYALSVPFVKGLFQQPWKQVVMATETTYTARPENVPRFVAEAYSNYASMYKGKFPFTVAPGSWPLGKTSTNKAAVMTVDKFQQNFTADYKAAKSYVWIFGNGTSWQSDKYGPVVPNFPQYLNAARNARKACTK